VAHLFEIRLKPEIEKHPIASQWFQINSRGVDCVSQLTIKTNTQYV